MAATLGVEPSSVVFQTTACRRPCSIAYKILARRAGVEPACVLYGFNCLENKADTDANYSVPDWI